MSDDPQLPVARSWPPGRDLPDAEAIAAQCASCGASWRVHTSLAGFRLRCSCNEWVGVPALPGTALPVAEPPPAALPMHIDARRRDASGLVTLPEDPGEVVYAPIPTDLPMAPGTLHRASYSNQTRWTNRTLLEFFAVMVALLGPQLLALLLSRGSEFELLLPFASLLSGVLVACVVAWAGPYGRLGFHTAALRHQAEALAVAAVGVVIAMGYVELLRRAIPELEPDSIGKLTERLGLPAALFVIAVAPAVLEEIMFRGMLQGRLLALLGLRLGIFVTAVAFALVHMQPLVLPIHLGIGIYLGWLRQRSGSLLPGMLMHFTYNGAIVVLGVC